MDTKILSICFAVLPVWANQRFGLSMLRALFNPDNHLPLTNLQPCYVMLLSILSKDRVVQKDKPVGVLPTKSTYTPEITKTMT